MLNGGKFDMKKFAILGIALVSTAAWAASSNSSQNACFGQARASAAIAGVVGYYASMRKGDNAAMNAAFREACQNAG